MQVSRLMFLTLIVSATAGAQGRLVPRPCPPPPECSGNRCIDTPTHHCLVSGAIIRTASQVRVTMVDRVLRFEVSETFVNQGGGLGEADYLFPLPAGSAFEDLRLSINGELVSGETLDAAEARQIYEDVVRRERDPALVEWMGSGLLRARIFPINPGEEKHVVVRFQSVARREGDALRIDYVRGTEPGGRPTGSTRASSEGWVTEEGGNTFSLSYPSSGEFGEPFSPTHSLDVKKRGRQIEVEARGESRELTVLLPLRLRSSTSVSVLTHRLVGEDGFALITITPPVAAGGRTPRDVTFVIDVSGSMSGRKLEQAKAAGRALLATLDRGDRFRLIDFATEVRSFHDGFLLATPQNLRSAAAYLDGLEAEGSTNISGALMEALRYRGVTERLPLVVFLTDGEPTVGERDPEAIAALAARNRGSVRIFTVGVSADVNAGLIERLAVEGHGTPHFVRDDENVERPVSLLASRLSVPLLTDVRVEVDGARLKQVLPQLPADIFAGQDLVLLARYDGSGTATVRVRGRTSAGETQWSSRVRFPRAESANAFVPRLWATQRIGWLASEKRRNGGNPEIDAEIKTLGTRYGIPTEFSSYLVVEPGMHADGDPGRNRARFSPMDLIRRRKATSSPAPTMSAGGASDASFEMARQAAEQRAATSLSAVDSLAREASGGALRRVGNRQFLKVGNVWTDQQHTTTRHTVKVKAFSPLYFQLLDRLTGLRETLVLGDEVLVSGRAVSIQVGPTGKERMSAAELNELVKVW